MYEPKRFHALIALTLCLCLTALLGWLLGAGSSWPLWLLVWLGVVNLITIGYYAYDKSSARANRRRIPEIVLHGLAASGGSPGALVAMNWFRHKTIKGPFRILFWCIVLVQTALVAWVLQLLYWP